MTIIRNADIVTMNPAQPSAESIAIRDGKIHSVGSNQAIGEQFPGADTVLDLGGQTLLPGFIDAHGHLSFTAKTVAAPNVASPPVGPVQNIKDVIDTLTQYAEKHPGDGWIFGFGYDDSLLQENRHPTKEELDRVSKTRPVAILHVSAHLMSCNIKCLELAGINAQSENPAGGIIRRIAGGSEPDGVLEETAMGPVLAVLPQADEQTSLYLLARAMDYYASHGITTVQDGATNPPEIKLLRTAAQAGQLMLDVVAFPVVSSLGADASEYSYEREYSNRFRVGGIKLVLDGSPQGKTAWLSKPYLHPPHGQDGDYRGYPTLKSEQVNQYIYDAFAQGTPVIAHANGDAAADQLIAAVEAANNTLGNSDRRTVMIHAQTAREDQIDAMLQQNILPSYFSVHTFYWGDWHRDSVFGEARARRISPLKSSAEKGLRFTTHNDTPVVPADMLRLVWASVNRETRSGQTLGAEQQITPLQALRSVTIDAAHQYFEENEKGSIEPGKLADLVVLSHNPLKVNPKAIKDITVNMTLKEGQVVYQRAAGVQQ